ncbi:MAG: hypothetical protein AAGD12_15695 [Pseudomonadota bacterium]
MEFKIQSFFTWIKIANYCLTSWSHIIGLKVKCVAAFATISSCDPPKIENTIAFSAIGHAGNCPGYVFIEGNIVTTRPGSDNYSVIGLNLVVAIARKNGRIQRLLADDRDAVAASPSYNFPAAPVTSKKSTPTSP